MSDVDSVAYKQGEDAGRFGRPIGSNPYDPEGELEKYEAWMDGWSTGAQLRNTR